MTEKKENERKRHPKFKPEDFFRKAFFTTYAFNKLNSVDEDGVPFFMQMPTAKDLCQIAATLASLDPESIRAPECLSYQALDLWIECGTAIHNKRMEQAAELANSYQHLDWRKILKVPPLTKFPVTLEKMLHLVTGQEPADRMKSYREYLLFKFSDSEDPECETITFLEENKSIDDLSDYFHLAIPYYYWKTVIAPSEAGYNAANVKWDKTEVARTKKKAQEKRIKDNKEREQAKIKKSQ
jgi:hypothetical protein